MGPETHSLTGTGRWLAALGEFCWHRPWIVIACWALATLAAGSLIPGMADRLLSGSGKIQGSMSERVDAQLVSDFGISEGQSLILVFQSSRLDDPQVEDEIVEQIEDVLSPNPEVEGFLAGSDLVEGADESFTRALIINFRTDNALATEQQVPLIRQSIDQLFMRLLDEIPDLKWAVTGRAALTHDINILSAQDSVSSELRALPLALLVLVYAFGALASAGLPIMLAIGARTLALATVLIIAGSWEVSNLVQSIATMMSLALGIDYSLFIYHRYRQFLQESAEKTGEQQSEACRLSALRAAMSTSGVVILYSGTVVAIGMGGLLLTPLMQTRSIGLGGMAAALFSMACALTLLPAVLALIGTRALDWPTLFRSAARAPKDSNIWAAWGERVVRHPAVFIAISLGLIGLMATPATQTVFGFPDDEFLPADLESARGLEMLDGLGGKGLVSPIFVIISDKSQQPVMSPQTVPELSRFIAEIASDKRVSEVTAPSLVTRTRFTPFAMPGTERQVSENGDKILLRIIPSTDTNLAALRELAREIPHWIESRSLVVEVGGQAQYFNDFDDRMLAAYPLIIGLVLTMTGITVLILLRAPLAAAKAMVLNLLSVAAGYGMVVYVFQLGYGSSLFGLDGPTGQIPSSVPIVIFAILFGLSMDYEIFLISRMREAFLRSGDNEKSIVEALAETGSVITSAALIMAVVFGAFAFSRIVIVQMTGLGLAVAVIVDAVIIRSLLGPALMALAGNWNWWPMQPAAAKHKELRQDRAMGAIND